MRIAEHVEMLEIKGINGIVYPTLAWDDENFVLIDAGFPGQKTRLSRPLPLPGSPQKSSRISC